MGQRRAKSLNPQAIDQYGLQPPAPVLGYDLVRRLLDNFSRCSQMETAIIVCARPILVGARPNLLVALKETRLAAKV